MFKGRSPTLGPQVTHLLWNQHVGSRRKVKQATNEAWRPGIVAAVCSEPLLLAGPDCGWNEGLTCHTSRLTFSYHLPPPPPLSALLKYFVASMPTIKGRCQEAHTIRSPAGLVIPDARRLALMIWDVCVWTVSPAKMLPEALLCNEKGWCAVGGVEGQCLGTCPAQKPGSSSWP